MIEQIREETENSIQNRKPTQISIPTSARTGILARPPTALAQVFSFSLILLQIFAGILITEIFQDLLSEYILIKQSLLCYLLIKQILLCNKYMKVILTINNQMHNSSYQQPVSSSIWTRIPDRFIDQKLFNYSFSPFLRSGIHK